MALCVTVRLAVAPSTNAIADILRLPVELVELTDDEFSFHKVHVLLFILLLHTLVNLLYQKHSSHSLDSIPLLLTTVVKDISFVFIKIW